MANTFTLATGIDPLGNVGNMKLAAGVYDALDGAGSSVASGLEYIFAGNATPKSSTTGGTTLTVNANVDGDFQVLSATSGDSFYVMLVGR